MLATFVIGLREGLEAALIVGIIAAFLSQDGRQRALRLMWIGVGTAVAVCLGIGVTLVLVSTALPQRQQEMLETVIGLVAVAMVTWMALWMRAHSKDLKKDLGTAVGGALAAGSSIALVAMAFLAVVREGVETAVFLVAASQTSAGASTFVGAGLGIAVAVVLGYLIYRGGVRLNLSRFFRVTGVVLVLVAGGVLMSSLYHAYEADWVTVGNRVWLDLSAVIQPGSVPESLLSGVLGIRAQLRAIDVLAWALYVLPMLLVVLWPPRRPLARRTVRGLLLGGGTVAVVAAALLAVLLPPTPPPPAAEFVLASSDAGTHGRLQVTVEAADGRSITVTVTGTLAAAGMPSVARVHHTDSLALSGAERVAGRSAATYSGERFAVPVAGGRPTVTAAELADLNGGRFPVGLRADEGDAVLDVTRTVTIAPTATVDAATGALLSLSATVTPAVVAAGNDGSTHRIRFDTADVQAQPESVAAATAAASEQQRSAERADLFGRVLPWVLGVWGALLLIFGGLLIRSRPSVAAPVGARLASCAVPSEKQGV